MYFSAVRVDCYDDRQSIPYLPRPQVEILAKILILPHQSPGKALLRRFTSSPSTRKGKVRTVCAERIKPRAITIYPYGISDWSDGGLDQSHVSMKPRRRDCEI